MPAVTGGAGGPDAGGLAGAPPRPSVGAGAAGDAGLAGGAEAAGDAGPTGDAGPAGGVGAAGDAGPAGGVEAAGDAGPAGGVEAAGDAGPAGGAGAAGGAEPAGAAGTAGAASAVDGGVAAVTLGISPTRTRSSEGSRAPPWRSIVTPKMSGDQVARGGGTRSVPAPWASTRSRPAETRLPRLMLPSHSWYVRPVGG
jgi:hypothetical protein